MGGIFLPKVDNNEFSAAGLHDVGAQEASTEWTPLDIQDHHLKQFCSVISDKIFHPRFFCPDILINKVYHL